MSFNYFIPLIHLGPLYGYTFIQELPLNEIKGLIGKTCPMFYKDRVLDMINELNRINKVTWYTLKICIMENMIYMWD